MKDPRKQTIRLPEIYQDEITENAKRLERSRSWIIQHAWKIAKKEIKASPTESRDSEE